MSGSLTELRSLFDQAKGKRSHIVTEVKRIDSEASDLKNEQQEWEQAQAHIQAAVQQTQSTLKYRIGEVCSLALETIFDDPYELGIDFVPKYGKTSGEIYFLRNGNKICNPLYGSGGGACDSASIGLIFSMWSLRVPRSRAFMAFDEPFRNLDRYEELQRAKRASELMKQISRQMKMQTIIVTHNKDLIHAADKVIDLGKKRTSI